LTLAVLALFKDFYYPFRGRESMCAAEPQGRNVYTLIDGTLKADGLLLTGNLIKFLGIWPIRKGMEDPVFTVSA